MSPSAVANLTSVMPGPDGRVAHLSRPGQPERRVALHRRDTTELLEEELRRLDPDDVYADVLAGIERTEVAAP